MNDGQLRFHRPLRKSEARQKECRFILTGPKLLRIATRKIPINIDPRQQKLLGKSQLFRLFVVLFRIFVVLLVPDHWSLVGAGEIQNGIPRMMITIFKGTSMFV